MGRITASSAFPFLLLSLLTACGDSVGPTPSRVPAPAPAPAPAPQPSEVTLSGVVYEHTSTGPRPLGSVRFLVLWSQLWDYQGSSAVLTNGIGRYSASGQSGSMVLVDFRGAGYLAPCPAGFEVLDASTTMDIHVVSEATLSTTGMPASLPVSGPRVSGSVFEQMTSGRQPIVGASVYLAENPEDEVMFSATRTDARGAFLLCTNPPGTGVDRTLYVSAYKEGYGFRSLGIVITGDDRVDLELVRK